MFNIGNTPLTLKPELNALFGIDPRVQIYVKDESFNEASGTFKDRRNLTLARSLDPWIRNYIEITSGNDGYSRARIFKEERPEIKVINIVDHNISPSIEERLREVSEIIKCDLTSGIIKPSVVAQNDLKLDPSETASDLTNVPIMDNNFKRHGYSQLATEIFEKIVPNYIFLPVGSGELFSYVWPHVYYRESNKEVKIVGVTAANANPFAMIRTPIDWKNYVLITGNLTPFLTSDNEYLSGRSLFNFLPDFSTIADKLSTPYSPWLPFIMNQMSKSNERIKIEFENDEKIKDAYFKCREAGINVEPSAATPFAALNRYKFKPGDIVVVINTGEGLYDKATLIK